MTAAAPSRPAAPPRTVAPGAALTSLLRRVWPAALVVVIGLVAWQVAVQVSGVRPQVLPSPLRVVEQGWANRALIWANVVPTLVETAAGFAVSLVVGWVLAIAADFVPWLKRALTPLLVASQTLPIVAIAPLVIIWFGFGLAPKVVVIAPRDVLPGDGRG